MNIPRPKPPVPLSLNTVSEMVAMLSREHQLQIDQEIICRWPLEEEIGDVILDRRAENQPERITYKIHTGEEFAPKRIRPVLWAIAALVFGFACHSAGRLSVIVPDDSRTLNAINTARAESTGNFGSVRYQIEKLATKLPKPQRPILRDPLDIDLSQLGAK